MFKLIVSILIVLFSFLSKNVCAQTIKMTVAQAGVNPGTSLYFIAQKENLFAKHGLEVKIVDTTTPAAVQAMLGGSMSLTLGPAQHSLPRRWKALLLSWWFPLGSTCFPMQWSPARRSLRYKT